MNQKINSCHVMAKPSGSVCNISCKYCFYLEKEKLYPERNQSWRMTDETLDHYIKQHIDAQSGNEVIFSWQGGEPTLLGVDFYEKAVQLCNKYNSGKDIYHSFQTNGILIDEQWCDLFIRHNFLVGLSVDGPEDLHDTYRVTRSGKPTHKKVSKAIKLLNDHGVKFNTLTVVNSKNVKEALRVYEYLKRIGSTYIQFIPLVERYNQELQGDLFKLSGPNEPLASMTDWSVDPDDYAQFLIDVFDQWVTNDVGDVFVQIFDTTLSSWLGQDSGLCIFAETCGHAFALEANGDLYQCDHYVYPEYKLGNIHDVSIKEINNKKQSIKFGLDKRDNISKDCLKCDYKFACNGGCPKHRFEVSENGNPNHNYLCSSYYQFFSHSEKYMLIMAKMIKSNRPASTIVNYVRYINKSKHYE